MTTNEKIASIRNCMAEENIAAYIIPTSDPHQSEYVADFWKFRTWVSGFKGSMGYVVITKNDAGVWTDGRYFLQCEKEIAGTEFKLHKQLQQGAPEHINWLCEQLKSGDMIGCDGKLFSPAQIRTMQRAFEKHGIELVTHIDMANRVWENRPPMPEAKIFEHPVEFAGKSRDEKLADIRAKMETENANYHLVTTLDDIAWTLNLRGSDVECNPVFYAYMVIGKEKTWLFVDESKLSAISYQLSAGKHNPAKIENRKSKIENRPYNDIHTFLKKLTRNDTIVVDAGNANYALVNDIKKAKIVEHETFSILMKAVKNPVEMEHIRNVMVKDGVALTKAFMWLEHTLDTRTISEYEFASMLAQFRSDQPHYFGESFDAIVGYKSNGAMMHYKPTLDGSAQIEKGGILLVDSGGQYADGTTDITRTIALSEPTAEQKKNFTLVLKGHIALARAVFPSDTKGVQFDILARQFLWQHFLNFGHGTGHGVGFFMNVHEPPQGFVAGLNARGTTPHQIGMLTSNEPGFYLEGEYGIRIENLLLCVEKGASAFGKFLCFETVTLFPMDDNLIDHLLLNQDEIDWLNKYQSTVYDKLSPHLNESEKKWLNSKCAYIIPF